MSCVASSSGADSRDLAEALEEANKDYGAGSASSMSPDHGVGEGEEKAAEENLIEHGEGVEPPMPPQVNARHTSTLVVFTNYNRNFQFLTRVSYEYSKGVPTYASLCIYKYFSRASVIAEKKVKSLFLGQRDENMKYNQDARFRDCR